MVLHLKQGEQAHFHFQALAASFAIPPGADGEQARGQFWFDPETMRPLINGPGQVAALELLAQLNELGPTEQIGWRLPQAWEYYLRGKALMMFSFGDLGALVPGQRRLAVKGECGAAVLPGSTRAWDGGQECLGRASPTRSRSATRSAAPGTAWSRSRPRTPKAAYALLSLMAIPPVSSWNAEHGWTGVNPGFAYQLLPPEGTGAPRRLHQGRLGPDRRRGLSARLPATFNAPTMLPYLRIRGTPEYWSRPRHRSSPPPWAAARRPRKPSTPPPPPGRRSPTASGRQQQLDAYRSAIGLTPGSG